MTDDQRVVQAAAERIRVLNDEFHTSLRGGSVLITAGIIARGGLFQQEVLRLARDFDTFDEKNDPYGEHDFGALDVHGASVFFKIDYYDQSLTDGSRDPADPTLTHRILTIMLAKEY